MSDDAPRVHVAVLTEQQIRAIVRGELRAELADLRAEIAAIRSDSGKPGKPGRVELAEAARRLDCSVSYLREMIADGLIIAQQRCEGRTGSKLYISEAELERFMKESERKPSPFTRKRKAATGPTTQ